MLLRSFVRLSAIAGVLLLGCTTVEAARLAAPSNVAPTGVADDAIEITWSTDEPNLVGFWVERSKPGKRRGFKKIATIGDGDARSFVDTGLESSTVYYYRLRSLQENRSRSGKLKRPKKSRKTKPVSGQTLAEAPAPQPTATAGGPPPPPPTPLPPPAGGESNPFALGGGSGETDIGTAAAVDSGGNVVVTGRFMDRADFGGSRISSRGSFDVFLARYDAEGSHLWSKGFGGSEGDDGKGVAVDAAGNVFVTGFFRRSANFGGSTFASAGYADAFLAKFAPDGTHLWSQRFGGSSGNDMGYAVATDASGNVVLVGSFHGNVSFGGAALVPSFYAPTDLFVAKFDPNGQHLWSRNYASLGVAIAHGVAVGRDGSIAVTGLFNGSLDFGNNKLTSDNFTDDGFVAKLAADGGHVWSRSFGSTNSDYGAAVAMDDDGNVFVTGIFRHSVDFGGGALTNTGAGSAFFVKYAASNGLHRWSHHARGDQTTAGTSIAVDADGNACVTGWFTERTEFGGTPVTSAGETDAFLARYSSNGQLRSAEALGGSGDDLGNGVALGPDGLVVATGAFSGSASFRGTPLSSAGGHDVYVVQLTP